MPLCTIRLIKSTTPIISNTYVTLYGFDNIHSHRCALTLAAKKIKYTYATLTTLPHWYHQPPFYSRAPLLQIKDKPTPIYGTLEIMQYLQEAFPSHGINLSLNDPYTSALSRMAITQINKLTTLLPIIEKNSAVDSKTATLLAKLDSQLNSNDFLYTDEEPTMCDLFAIPYVRAIMRLSLEKKILLEFGKQYPKLSQWLEKFYGMKLLEQENA